MAYIHLSRTLTAADTVTTHEVGIDVEDATPDMLDTMARQARETLRYAVLEHYVTMQVVIEDADDDAR